MYNLSSNFPFTIMVVLKQTVGESTAKICMNGLQPITENLLGYFNLVQFIQLQYVTHMLWITIISTVV